MKDAEESFEVVDKRRKAPESDATAESETQGGRDARPDEAEAVDGKEEDGRGTAEGRHEAASGEDAGEDQLTIDVPGLLGYILGLLGSAAWQRMGVVINPATGRSDVNLAQARLAIDTFEAVAEKLMPHLDDRGQREVRGGLADLRMNYVERSTGTAKAGQ